MKILIAFILVTITFAACANPIAPASTGAGETTLKKERAIMPVESEDQSRWQKLIATAKKEGIVVVYGAAAPVYRDIIVKGMRDNFGLNAEIMGLKTEQLIARVHSERRAGIMISDVYIGNPMPSLSGLKPGGYLEKLDDILFLPEVINPKLWYEGRLPYVDRDRTVFAFSAYPQNAIAINTNLVKTEEIKSFLELLEPKWKGKMVIPDPSQQGSMQQTFVAVGLKLVNWDYWKSFVKQEPLIIRDQRLLGDWLAQGKYPIGFGLASMYAELKKLGAPLLELEMREGSYLSAGGGSISLFKNAPHPSAATVLINWLLTREAQDTWAKGALNQSAREDIPSYMEEGKKRQPGKVYFDAISEEFFLSRDEYTEKAKDIFGPLLK